MNKLFIILLAVSLLTACEKDNKPPTVSEIEITNGKIGVGQLVVAKITIVDPENSADIKYEWSDDFGFTSDQHEFNWRPSKKGQHNIKVTITDGVNIITKTKSVMVSECDYRLAFWNDDINDVMIHEQPEAPYIESSALIYRDKFDPTIGHAYVYNSYQNIYAGVDIYTKVYESGYYNNYISDFELHRSELIEKYGNPYFQDTLWAANMINPSLYINRKENWGEALRLKYVEFQSVWEYNGNVIDMRLVNNGNIVFGTVFQKISKGETGFSIENLF